MARGHIVMRADKLTGELLCSYGAMSRPAFGPIIRQVRRPHRQVASRIQYPFGQLKSSGCRARAYMEADLSNWKVLILENPGTLTRTFCVSILQAPHP